MKNKDAIIFLRRVALCSVVVFAFQMASANAATATGAGSSAAAPIYRTWAKSYLRATGSSVEYDSIGSSAGMKKIQQNAVGFGATDVYPREEDLINGDLVVFPIAITGISPIINLPRIQNGQLRLTGEVLSRIFMGEISHWNASEIAELNPDIVLPDLAIKVVVRADGSGTTYNFADYLAKTSQKWKSTYGVKTTIQWPDGFGSFKGSDGVSKAVRDTVGAIGYVDYGYVAEYGLTAIQMKNSDGFYIKPSLSSFKSALKNSEWSAKGKFNNTLTSKPGKDAWPITMGTFVIFPRMAKNAEQTAAALQFILWSFFNGDTLVQENNFVRLPDRVQASAFRMMTSIRDQSGMPLNMELMSLPAVSKGE